MKTGRAIMIPTVTEAITGNLIMYSVEQINISLAFQKTGP